MKVTLIILTYAVVGDGTAINFNQAIAKCFRRIIMGEAKRRKQSDSAWGKEREVFPDKNYPCVAIISYLYGKYNTPVAIDVYVHNDDNKDEAWEILKQENPKGYEQSKKLHETAFPHLALIKSNSEMKHFIKTISAVAKMPAEKRTKELSVVMAS